jgi:hypothetical protein
MIVMIVAVAAGAAEAGAVTGGGPDHVIGGVGEQNYGCLVLKLGFLFAEHC